MLEARVEEIAIGDIGLGGVLLGQGGVGFDDGYKLGVGVLGKRGEEVFYMSVHEGDDGDSDGFVFR